MSTKNTPTDAYGDLMVFVESYGGHLPCSANIPQTRPQKGVTGITHNGEIYCVDCAVDMGIIDRDDLDKHSRELGPWTGVVLPSYETDTIHHCGNHDNCCNAVDGENHPYNHEHTIGIGINERAIQH